MVSPYPVKFGGRRQRGSGHMMFLVVEGQHFTSPCFNPLLLFVSKGHGMPCSRKLNT